MKSATKLNKKQQKKIGEWIKEAQTKLRVNDWSISVEFDAKIHVKTSMMECSASYKCRRATIGINDEVVLRGWSRKGFVRCACFHEVAHIITEELCRFAESRYVSEQEVFTADERVTELIAKIAADYD